VGIEGDFDNKIFLNQQELDTLYQTNKQNLN